MPQISQHTLDRRAVHSAALKYKQIELIHLQLKKKVLMQQLSIDGSVLSLAT